jgi:hypothetical protein
MLANSSHSWVSIKKVLICVYKIKITRIVCPVVSSGLVIFANIIVGIVSYIALYQGRSKQRKIAERAENSLWQYWEVAMV